MSRWISVYDDLPEEQVMVLVARKYIGGSGHEISFVETAYRVGDMWYSYTDGWELKRSGDGSPYAWTPLPTAPKEV